MSLVENPPQRVCFTCPSTGLTGPTITRCSSRAQPQVSASDTSRYTCTPRDYLEQDLAIISPQMGYEIRVTGWWAYRAIALRCMFLLLVWERPQQSEVFQPPRAKAINAKDRNAHRSSSTHLHALRSSPDGQHPWGHSTTKRTQTQQTPPNPEGRSTRGREDREGGTGSHSDKHITAMAVPRSLDL